MEAREPGGGRVSRKEVGGVTSKDGEGSLTMGFGSSLEGEDVGEARAALT